jgi:6-bladed beta-propeller
MPNNVRQHIALGFLLSLLLYSCSRQKEAAVYSGKTTRTIPVNVEKYRNADFNDLFKIEKIIRLAANDSVLIGRVDKISWFENKFYILDGKTNYIDVFDSSGRFLFNISSIGEGKDQYFRIADFDIDSDAQQIYVLDDFKRKIVVFSAINGQPVEERPLFNFTVNKFSVNSSNNSRQLIFSRGGTAESSDMWYNILIADSTNTIRYRLLPYISTGSFVMSPEQPLQKIGNRVSYLPPFSSIIFGLNEDHTLSAKYILQFQGASNDYAKMEADLKKNSPKTIAEFLQYLDDNNYIKFLNYLETDSLLYVYYSTAKQGNQFLLYEKNKDSALLISTIHNNYINFSGQPKAATRDNQFICLIEPDSFLNKELIKAYLPLKDRDLSNFDSRANPMLAVLKVKPF